MLLIIVALLVVIGIAGLIAAFAAFPHRGEAIPHAAWLSNAMVKASDKVNARIQR